MTEQDESGYNYQPGDPAEPRELVGRMVRQIWVEWAQQQPNPKPSWLLPWDELDDGQREVDMRIGAALFEAGQRAESYTFVQIVNLLNECPPPDVYGGYDLCPHGQPWPCATTKARWLARGVTDPTAEARRLMGPPPDVEWI